MGDEVEAAHTAARYHAKECADVGDPIVFDRIISNDLPHQIVLAFCDISPRAPTHVILIPKLRDGLTQLSKAKDRHEHILGHLMVVAAKVARQEGLHQGFRVLVNDGLKGCKSVYHLHLLGDWHQASPRPTSSSLLQGTS